MLKTNTPSAPVGASRLDCNLTDLIVQFEEMKATMGDIQAAIASKISGGGSVARLEHKYVRVLKQKMSVLKAIETFPCKTAEDVAAKIRFGSRHLRDFYCEGEATDILLGYIETLNVDAASGAGKLFSVSAAIKDHLRAVHADEANFGPDGEPIDQGAADKSLKVESDAFKRFISAPCLSALDVQRKVHYVLHGTVGERDELLSVLGYRDLLENFIRSLEIAPPVPSDQLAVMQEAASLTDAIEAYLDGMRRYNGSETGDMTEEQELAFVAETYGDAMDVLTNWERAARSYDEAQIALRLAIKELDEQHVYGPAPSLMKAAAAYFGEAGICLPPAMPYRPGLGAEIAELERRAYAAKHDVPEDAEDDHPLDVAYGEQYERLVSWTEPAETVASCLQALKLARNHLVKDVAPLSSSMIDAAVGFIERHSDGMASQQLRDVHREMASQG